MLEADSILWLFTVGFIGVVLVAVLAGILAIHRHRQAQDDEPTYVSIGKVALALGVFVATVVTFALVTDGWMDQERMYELDLRVHEFFAALEGALITDIMLVMTWFGSTQGVIAAAVILGIYFWRDGMRRQFVNLVIVFVPGTAALWMLKAIFSRERPGEALAPTVGHSFPSGHSFSATIIYGFLIYLAWTETQSAPLRIGLTIFLSLIILTVAASRIVLNVHWASDVIGGVLFGLAWLVSSLMISSIAADVITQRRPSMIAEK